MKTKTKTKTKPALCARKMFANYYPRADGFVCLHGTRTCAKDNAAEDCLNAAIPVAVIPLDDAQALIDLATSAHYNAVQAHPYHVPTPGAMVAALAAIGLLPKPKKGRK